MYYAKGYVWNVFKVALSTLLITYRDF